MDNKFTDDKRKEAEDEFTTRMEKFKVEDAGYTATDGEDKVNRFKDAIPKPLVEIWEDIKELTSLLKDYATKQYTNIPAKSIVAIGAAIAYFVSPVDAIPDIVPVFGFMDDATVLAIALKMVQDDLEKYRIWKDKNK